MYIGITWLLYYRLIELLSSTRIILIPLKYTLIVPHNNFTICFIVLSPRYSHTSDGYFSLSFYWTYISIKKSVGINFNRETVYIYEKFPVTVLCAIEYISICKIYKTINFTHKIKFWRLDVTSHPYFASRN